MTVYLGVKTVEALDDYMLMLVFSNKEKRIFDMKPYLNKGIFKELNDVKLFNTVRVSFDTIEWDNEADMDPEVLYKYSKKLILKAKHKSHSSLAAEPRPKYRKV